MTFLQDLLMWFPPCALCVAVAWITERAWLAEDEQIKRGLFRRFLRAQIREKQNRVPADTRPQAYMATRVLWQLPSWSKL